MFSNLLVNAKDIAQWAERKDSQVQLPRLVRRLVQATTPDIERLQFNTDEGTQLDGWDGLTSARSGNVWVPAGAAGWEVSARADIKGKADSDYDTRTENPLGFDPKETTFVFVTPRQWKQKEKWAENRRAEGVWADVRAYDAHDLEIWLEQAPAVHLWLSMLIGKCPPGAKLLDDFWSDWTAKTSPTVSPALVIGGRQAARERVETWLRGEATSLALEGESSDEALAFLSAVIAAQEEPEREGWFSRSIVVEDATSWRALTLSDARLILVPQFQGEIEGTARAVKNGNHVFVAGEHSGAQGDNALPRIVRDAAEEALLEMGMPRDRASNLATLARRSLPALRRKLACEPIVKKPEWAQQRNARVLLAPLLAGTWQDPNAADRKMLACLAGTSYEQLQETLVIWSKSADPPLRLVGGIWMMVAPEDAWRLLAPYLTSDDLTRFKAVALEVLSAKSNSSSPIIERLGSSVNNEAPCISGTLREGIASTLALMTAVSSQVTFVSGGSGEEVARSVVWSLFDKAKSDAEAWASFAPVLPLLAEAAPKQFLDAVDAGLTGETPFLRQMFYNEDNIGFGPTSPHTFLLWALETLAWNPKYFGRAVLCLARLTRIDPGGKNGNRASSSLRETFVVWYPNTTVSLESRLQVLDVIRKREPAVAWSLMIRLLPTIHSGICHPLHGPKWHDWKPDEERRIPQSEMVQAWEAIVERLLLDVGVAAPRWCELIERIEGLWPQLREKVLGQLAALDPAALDPQERMTLVDALRTVIVRHRAAPDAHWTMPNDDVERLETTKEKLEPSDPVMRHRWRFRQFVPLPERYGTDWQKRNEIVEQLRNEALQEILTDQGWEGVLRLASQVEDPQNVGATLAAMPQPPVDEDVFLAENLASSESWRAAMALGWVGAKVWRNDEKWLQTRLSKAQDNWRSEQWGEFFRPYPLTASLLNQLETLNEESQRYYWNRIQGTMLLNEPKDIERVIERLLWAGRAATAIKIIHWAIHDKPDLIPPERIMDVLEAAIESASVEELRATDYDSAELLDHLAKTDTSRERLARLEWQYFGLHRHTRIPKILHEELARDPAFFVEILSLIYRARPGETETDERSEDSAPLEEVEPEDQERAQLKAVVARLAYSLLDDWHQIPGTREDGMLDEEHLKNWVSRARELASECERSVITLLHIGRVLARSPRDENGAWPHRAVRDIIDEIANPRLDAEFHCQVFNDQGSTSRGLTDGGAQERTLVEKYEKDAAQIADSWPRTASVLRGLADDYRRHADREDRSADLTQDFWS